MKQGNGSASIISLIWTMMRSEVLICLRVYVRVIITNNWLWAFFVLDISIKKWMCSMICHNYVVITTEKCFESKPWLSTRRTGSWFLPHFVRYMISIRKMHIQLKTTSKDYPCSTENEKVLQTDHVFNLIFLGNKAAVSGN